MPVLGALIIVCQVLFAIHAVRTGRDQFWLWLIIVVPGIGCLIYFLTQVLPELLGSRTARRAGNVLVKAVDPQREFRQRLEELKRADTVDNRIALADECIEANLLAEAIDLLEGCLTGVHATDPAIMERLARAHFENNNAPKTQLLLEDLIEKNPDYQSYRGHLLYARSLEQQAKLTEAANEYDVLRTSFPGEEARVRYGQMLFTAGEIERAHELFNESLERAKLSPKHYRKREKHWLDIARRGLSEVG